MTPENDHSTGPSTPRQKLKHLYRRAQEWIKDNPGKCAIGSAVQVLIALASIAGAIAMLPIAGIAMTMFSLAVNGALVGVNGVATVQFARKYSEARAAAAEQSGQAVETPRPFAQPPQSPRPGVGYGFGHVPAEAVFTTLLAQRHHGAAAFPPAHWRDVTPRAPHASAMNAMHRGPTL